MSVISTGILWELASDWLSGEFPLWALVKAVGEDGHGVALGERPDPSLRLRPHTQASLLPSPPPPLGTEAPSCFWGPQGSPWWTAGLFLEDHRTLPGGQRREEPASEESAVQQ